MGETTGPHGAHCTQADHCPHGGRIRDLEVRWADLCTDTIMRWVGDLLTELDRRGHGPDREYRTGIDLEYGDIRPDESGHWRPCYWDELSAMAAQMIDGDGVRDG